MQINRSRLLRQPVRVAEIAQRGNTGDFLEALVKRHRAKRIRAQGRIWRIYVTLRKAKLEKLQDAERENGRATEQDKKWKILFHPEAFNFSRFEAN